MKKINYLTQGAVIAAAYFALTMLVAPIAYGPLQFRLSESLMLLPIITPAAVPGLFIGCLLFNLLNPASLGPIDIIFGSLATLLAAWLTYRMGLKLRPASSELTLRSPKLWLLPLPSVLANGLIVGGYLLFILPDTVVSLGAVLANMLSIGLCEAVVVYTIGIALVLGLLRNKAVQNQLRVREACR